jgi:TonB family protein
VSDEPIYGATMTIYASQDGGGGVKWLLSAAAAALAFGSGYVAWKNNAPGAAEAHAAAFDPYAGEPLRAHALPPSPAMIAAHTAAVAAATPHRAAVRAPPRRHALAHNAVLEETFGVAGETNSDEIVVHGVRRPVWARTPSARRMAALYPRQALERGREGEARLRCIVQADGALDCERVTESARGFGAAAIRVARGFRHAPRLADGADATGAQVNLRIVFRIAEDERRRA